MMRMFQAFGGNRLKRMYYMGLLCERKGLEGRVLVAGPLGSAHIVAFVGRRALQMVLGCGRRFIRGKNDDAICDGSCVRCAEPGRI